ncbi:MAG TPA: DUF4157 domain-containing protein [Thermoanaerobaculia bacterium]
MISSARRQFVPTRNSPPVLRRKCACGGSESDCAGCAKKNGLQRQPSGAAPASVPPIVGDVLQSSGHPLDVSARTFMESRFGHDFGHVRVHDDARASESASAVHALAYTVGDHIAFRAGQYAPSTDAGRQLLAHELTHVVQQQGASIGSIEQLRIGDPDDPAEREADAHVHGPVLSRAPEDSNDAIQAGPLPYVQATELAKCLEIMGKENTEYCREEVLGEKPAAKCASTFTIPDDVYDAIGRAWGKSGHGGATVQEYGGRIVNDASGKEQIREGSGKSGSISLPPEKKGDTTTGTYHTHPYSQKEHSRIGVSFSGDDIQNLIDKKQGGVKYVGAGSCIFILDTLSYTERDSCKKGVAKKAWDKAYKAATGTFQEQVETAVSTAIAGCGLCYYKVCRPDDASPVPKVANLV